MSVLAENPRQTWAKNSTVFILSIQINLIQAKIVLSSLGVCVRVCVSVCVFNELSAFNTRFLFKNWNFEKRSFFE